MSSPLTLAVLVLLIIGYCGKSSATWYTIYKDGPAYSVKNIRDTSGVVIADFEPTGNSTGWNTLQVISTQQSDDATTMYAAGYIEGYLTKDLIWQSWGPFLYVQFNNSGYNFPPGLIKFYRDNLAYMQQMIVSNPSDPYWVHVALVLQQLNGICDGYNQAASSTQHLSLMEIMFLNMDGDLDELLIAMGPSAERENWLAMTAKEAKRKRLHRDHCSGLVKVTDGFTDLFAGHTTWEEYEYLLRVFKVYDLRLQAEGTLSPVVVFSGYPALIASVDDFYITSQKLVVIETTNGIFNNSLYDLISAQCVVSWIRTVVANRMASSGQYWAEIFALQNSGTYNNQWFVVDYKLFTPGQLLQPGTLWVVEQIPGYVHSDDLTDVLSFGYWPSYNTPYFADIFALSGFTQMEQKYGLEWSYSLCSRAKIFRRDHHLVQNLTGMQNIMQYNNWQHDPFAEGDPTNQISARADLYTDPEDQDPFGGCDSKVVSSALVNSFAAMVISGPTHEYLPPFSWSQFPGTPHDGQPDLFDYDWMLMQYAPAMGMKPKKAT